MVSTCIYRYVKWINILVRSFILVHSSNNAPTIQKLQDSSKSPKTPLNHLQLNLALSKLFRSWFPNSKAKWAHNLSRIEQRKQRNQRRKMEQNRQGLHTIERVFSSSPYSFIYMLRLGPTYTTHMGECHLCNLTLSSNSCNLHHYFQNTFPRVV